ncbi:MAG TPA: inorganic diphosphatase [Myxococcaceae bacterium]|nr:inorganic diphosphatase [Myxococcaceae bacterium]
MQPLLGETKIEIERLQRAAEARHLFSNLFLPAEGTYLASMDGLVCRPPKAANYPRTCFMNDSLIRVFIENEAGSSRKNIFDEKYLTWLRSVTVSRKFPYTYGFILETTAEDGDNMDCYVLSSRPMSSGSIVVCRPVALLEQLEDGLEDHNVLAVPEGEILQLSLDAVVDELTDFISHVFDHLPGKELRLGEMLDEDAAREHIDRCRDLVSSVR